MKSKIIMVIFCFVVFATNMLAQTANAINIQDTRAVNDLPNFFGHGIRADFKQIGTIGVPGQGYYSTNITIGQWDDWNNSGGKNHQLNFNDGGFFYRSAYPTDPQWGTWRQVLMTNENGNVGIGTGAITPSEKLEIGGDSFSNIKIGRWATIGTTGGALATIIGNNVKASQTVSHRMEYITSTVDGGKAIKLQYNEGITFHTMLGTVNANEPFSNFERMRIDNNGNVGIGTPAPGYKLDVIGTIRSREVRVDMNGADFVFEEKYPLMPLTELEAYVKKNKHLPEIATAKEMQEQGSNLGDLNTKLLQKIEELTLYVIEQQKLITQQANELESHKVMLAKIDQMEKTLAKMNTANEK